jgi:ribonuclease HI
MYLLQFDGMLQMLTEHPQMGGFLGYGWLITRNDIEIAHGFGLFANKQTVNSNIAEYLALIEALEASIDLRIKNEQIEVHGDSRCVIDQMAGNASVNSLSIRNLYQRARKLAGKFKHLTRGWVPRHKNKLADSLSRRGLAHLYNQPGAYALALNQLDAQAQGGSGFISMLDLRVYNPMPFKKSHRQLMSSTACAIPVTVDVC